MLSLTRKEWKGCLLGPLLVFVSLTASLAVVLTILSIAKPCRDSDQLRLAFFGPPILGSLFYAILEYSRSHEAIRTAKKALGMGLVLLVFLSLYVPGLFGATSRAKQKRTMAQIRALAASLEGTRTAQGYPVLSSIRQLRLPRGISPTDGWGNELLVRSEPSRYVIVSFGECGEADQAGPWEYPPGGTRFYSDDIVFSNGAFVRQPEGLQQ